MRPILTTAFLAFFSLGRCSAVLDGLMINKVACCNAEASFEFRWLEQSEDQPAIDDRYVLRWAIKGDTSIATYLNLDGSERGSFVVGRHGDVYYDRDGKRARITYQVGHSDTYTALQFGLNAGGRWYADLVRDGFLHVTSESPDAVTVAGDVPGGTHVDAILKPSAGYLAVKSTLSNYVAGSECVTTVDRWERQGMAIFPTHGIAVHHESNPRQRSIKVELRVKELVIGTVPDRRFDLPELTPGSSIKDDRNGEMWEIGPNGERLFRGVVGHAEPKSARPTILGWVVVVSIATASTALVQLGARAIEHRERK